MEQIEVTITMTDEEGCIILKTRGKINKEEMWMWVGSVKNNGFTLTIER